MEMEHEIDEREILIKREDYVSYIKATEELKTLKRCLLRAMKLDIFGKPVADEDKVAQVIEMLYPDEYDAMAESLKVQKQAEKN